MYNGSCKHGILDCGKHNKIPMKQNWTSKECHEKNNEYVEHQDVNMYCANCTRALGKTYHMIFDTKLGHSTCETRHILCVCVETTVFPYFLTVE